MVNDTIDARLKVIETALVIRILERTTDDQNFANYTRTAFRRKLQILGDTYGAQLRGTPEGKYLALLQNEYGALNPAVIQQALDAPVYKLGLSAQPAKCLKTAGIRSCRQLVTKTYGELMGLPYFGRKALQEVQEALGKCDPPLSLGMRTDYVRPEERK